MEVDKKDDGKMEVEGQMESKQQQQQGSPVIVGKVDVLREEGNNYFKQGDFLKAKKCYEQVRSSIFRQFLNWTYFS